jgi:hypothetical protein
MASTTPDISRRNASINPVGVIVITEKIVTEMERVIAAERAQGTEPSDGTEAGRIMASELKWLDYQRGQLANARREATSWYDPLTR